MTFDFRLSTFYIQRGKEGDAVELVDDDVEAFLLEVAVPVEEGVQVHSEFTSSADYGVSLGGGLFGEAVFESGSEKGDVVTLLYKTFDDFLGHHFGSAGAGVFEVTPIEEEVVHGWKVES